MELTTIFLSFIFFIPLAIEAQEILIPPSHIDKDEAIFANHTKGIKGEGFFPISYNLSQRTFPEKGPKKKWFTRKLFREHFFQVNKENFLLGIDPVLHLSLGKDFGTNPTESYLFQNTRGIQVLGQIHQFVSFYTAVYENQARFSKYESEYFTSRGELYPIAGGKYSRSNAVIPNGGRTKPFKEDAFDYASAVSYIRITPIKEVAIQLGNAPRFYGWGYRSILLSDNSFNFTHITADFQITEQLTYTIDRGKQLNLYRRRHTNLVEKPYERTAIGLHYLTYTPTPSLKIGFFESTIYLRDKPVNSQKVNRWFYNPFIGINAIKNRNEASDMKTISGLNIAWQFHPDHLVYSQLAMDGFSPFEYGLQFGYRTGNPFRIKNLYLQLEFNMASNHLYAAQNDRLAYTHFNLPLAHTLGNGFKEVLVRGSYKWRGLYLQGKVIYYTTNQQLKSKSNFFGSKKNEYKENPQQVIHLNAELGYELNPSYRLRVFVAGDYRRGSNEGDVRKIYKVFSFGLKTDLTNSYTDF